MSWIKESQRAYILGRTPYDTLKDTYTLSPKTLQKYITETPLVTGELPCFTPDTHFACIIDATYFSSRNYGLALIRTNTGYNLNSSFISSESQESMTLLMNDFTNAGYPIHTESFTVDGRRLMIKLLEKKYPNIPIQMCLFHMKAIIRRYTTLRPKTRLGKALLILKACLGIVSEKMFIRLFESTQGLYTDFLVEKNIQGKYEHKGLRTVMRSIRYYLPYLYTYERLLLINPNRRIPRTTGECDGYFRHLKDYFRVHGGMRQTNRNNFIIFLLEEHNRRLQKDI